jgi:hypothetical protein
MARSIALLAIIAPASGHFVWLSANGHGEAVAEFNEPGRLTDPHLLGKLYNMTRGQVHTMEGTTSDLHFMTRGAGDGYHCAAEVYAPLPHQGSMAVEAQATYGLYAVGTDEGGTGEKDLLQYWATAVHAEPTEWGAVEDAFKNDFEVTLRDPQGAKWATVAPSVDVSNQNNECEPDAATHESGDTCVVAVVRWKGQRATFDVTVSTYDHTGAKLRDSIAEDGVVVVRAPADSQTYALVHHAEPKPGPTESGESYDVVNHYATTTFANNVHCHGGSCHTHAGAYAGPPGGMLGGYGEMGSTSERKADGDHAGNTGMLFFFSLFSACLGGAVGFVLGARRTERGFRLMFWRRGDARFDLEGSSKARLSDVI